MVVGREDWKGVGDCSGDVSRSWVQGYTAVVGLVGGAAVVEHRIAAERKSRRIPRPSRPASIVTLDAALADLFAAQQESHTTRRLTVCATLVARIQMMSVQRWSHALKMVGPHLDSLGIVTFSGRQLAAALEKASLLLRTFRCVSGCCSH